MAYSIACPPKAAIFCRRLMVVAFSAQRLMIVRIPEQHHIAFVRFDMVCAGGSDYTQRMSLARINAQWMLSQTRLAIG
jgi:hypothetical protein